MKKITVFLFLVSTLAATSRDENCSLQKEDIGSYSSLKRRLTRKKDFHAIPQLDEDDFGFNAKSQKIKRR
jgi:hypothetical protein